PWKKGQSLNVYSTERNRLYPLRLLIHRVFPTLLKVKKGSDVVFFAVHTGGKIITMYYEGDYKNQLTLFKKSRQHLIIKLCEILVNYMMLQLLNLQQSAFLSNTPYW